MNIIVKVKCKAPVESFEKFFTDELVIQISQPNISYETPNNRHHFTLSANFFF